MGRLSIRRLSFLAQMGLCISLREMMENGLAVKLDAIRTAIADYDRTDHVTDIRNHISPNTRVSEAHVNEAFKLNRLG